MANTEPETYLSKHSIMTKENLSPVVICLEYCVLNLLLKSVQAQGLFTTQILMVLRKMFSIYKLNLTN